MRNPRAPTLHLGDSTGVVVPGRMMFGDGYSQMMWAGRWTVAA